MSKIQIWEDLDFDYPGWWWLHLLSIESLLEVVLLPRVWVIMSEGPLVIPTTWQTRVRSLCGKKQTIRKQDSEMRLEIALRAAA